MQDSAKDKRSFFATWGLFGELHRCEDGTPTACDAIEEALAPNVPSERRSETNLVSRISFSELRTKKTSALAGTNPWRWERRAI